MRWNIENISEWLIENSGFTLLDTEYKDLKTPLKVLCGCGKETELSLKNIKRNPFKCENCGRGTKIKLIYNDIKDFVENNSNCKLIST